MSKIVYEEICIFETPGLVWVTCPHCGNNQKVAAGREDFRVSETYHSNYWYRQVGCPKCHRHFYLRA